MRRPLFLAGALVAGAVAACALAACADGGARPCASSRECDLQGRAGTCRPSPFSDDNWCGYPDPACPGSGERWSPRAGDGLADQCLTAAAPDAAAIAQDAAPPCGHGGRP